MSQKERENFYRHSVLIVDYIKDGLVDLIEVGVHNNHSSFEDLINKNQHEIYHLCYNRGRCCQCTPGYVLPQNRILHPSQLDLLFDKYGSKLPCHNPGRRADFCCSTAKAGLPLSVLDVTYARCILINFCKDVFWDSCLTNVGLTFEDFLNKHKHDLYHFFIGNQPCCQCFAGYRFPVFQRGISQIDWKLLFGTAHTPCAIHTIPSTGAPYVCSVSATVGISVNHVTPNLTSIILENFCTLRKSVDILVQTRNDTYGHAKEAKISDKDFTAYWTTTENALLEISKTSSKQLETKQKLGDLQKRCLDETILEQYKVQILGQMQMDTTIQEFIEEKTEEIKETIKKVEEKTDKMLHLMENVQQKFTGEQEMKRKKIREYIKARIHIHVNEKTYVSTNAEKIAMESIQNTGMVVIVGPPGAGKSRIGLELVRQYSDLHRNYECLQIDNIMEWDEIVNFDVACIILCDDIFGKTNCNYIENDHLRIIETIHTFVKSGQVKVIVTVRDSIKHACDHLFNRHAIFQDTKTLNIGTDYKMSEDEKRNCLISHLRKNSIEVTEDPSEEQLCLETKSETGFVHTDTINEIISLKPYNILGFAETCYLFASNRKFLKFGPSFFKRANEILCQTISDLRERGERERQCMLEYIILVYVLINGDKIDLCNINIPKLQEICLTTYPVLSNNLTAYEVENATTRLCGNMLQKFKSGRYSFQHRATFEAVLLSYRHFDQSKMIQLMDYKFILEFARPDEYDGLEGEVFVNIRRTHYQELANKILSQGLKDQPHQLYRFVQELVSSKICSLASVEIIKELCDIYHKFWSKNESSFNVIRLKTFTKLHATKRFDLSGAILLYTDDNDVIQYLIKHIDNKLSSRKPDFAKDLLSTLFILLCHEKSEYKAREIWKLVKSHQIYITSKGFIFDSGWELVVRDMSIHKFMWTIVDDNKLLDLKAIMSKACYYGDEAVVNFLLETFDHSLFDAMKAMNNACKSGKVDVLNLILRSFDHTLFDVKDAMNNACKSGTLQVVMLLLRTFDPSQFDIKDAMNNACKTDEAEVLKLLLETFDNSIFDSKNAMNIACFYGRAGLVKFLLETFDHSQFCVQEAMHNACVHGRVEVIQLLSQTFDHNMLNLKKEMITACQNGKNELATFMLESFEHRLFDVNLALKESCRKGRIGVTKLLLEKCDHQKLNLRIALNIAKSIDNKELVIVLKDAISLESNHTRNGCLIM